MAASFVAIFESSLFMEKPSGPRPLYHCFL